ncbi:MAG: VOC family protein [Ignavibacteriae bacterium]|nr:VOC family protein [Ignavibacteriota bacterium]
MNSSNNISASDAPSFLSTQKITTFLTFNNQAEEASNFYTSVFKDSKVIQKTINRDERAGKVGAMLIATLELFGQKFMLLNGGPSFTFTQGFSLMVNCDTQAEIDEYWEKLTADGGKEVMCGWLTDKFGVSWQIVPFVMGKLMSSGDPEKSKRVMDAMMQMVKLDITGLQKAFDGV